MIDILLRRSGLVALLLTVAQTVALAQAPTTVTGTVYDALTGEPLPNVQVAAHPVADSAVVASVLSNSAGRFTITGLPAGSYRISFRLIGFTRAERTVSTAGGAPVVDLGRVPLSLEPVTLDEVTVTAPVEPVIYAPDRDIYAVDAMPAAAGGTATDALAQVPDLEVDINGEVTLRGNTPTIYINGRPAPMQGESLAFFLQQFPAENIQSIEVMPNPSARYEAEGAGGIVNIVLKRGVRLGLTGNVFANVGTRGELGSGARATYMAGDLTVQAGTSARYTRTETNSAELRENLLADPVTLLEQETISNRSGGSGNVDLEVEYSFSEQTRLTVESRFNGNLFDADRTTSYTEMQVDSTITDQYDRVAADDSRGHSIDLAFDLRHDFEPRGHDLRVEVEYQRNRDLQESLIRQRLLEELAEEDPAIELTLDDQNENENETGLRIDYSRPVGERGQIEVGYQAEFGESVDGQLRRIGIDGLPEEEMELIDRGFSQRQRVHSGYLTAMRRFGDLSAQLGVRAERTDDTYRLNVDGLEFGSDYLSFFPSANITYQLGSSSRLRASYSMRVRRPSANLLNPTNRSTDPMNRRVGNPDLEPQYTHSFSFDASWRRGPTTLRIAPFYQRNVDEFTEHKTIDELGVSTTTWENLASSASYGTSVSLSLRDWNGLGGSIHLNGRREERDDTWLQEENRRSSTRWSLRTNLHAQVGSTLTLQTNINYDPPREFAQGRRSGTVMINTGIRKRFLDGRASVNLNVADPFDLYRPSVTYFDRAFRESGRERVSIRRASLSLSYTFGGRGRGGGERGWRGRGGWDGD